MKNCDFSGGRGGGGYNKFGGGKSQATAVC